MELLALPNPAILSLSTVFPNPGEPELGVFVERRLEALGALLPVTVLAPLPWVDYSRGLRSLFPAHRRDWHKKGPLQVVRPRWFYPPKAGAFSPIFLFLSLLWPVYRLRRRFDLLDAHFGHPEGVAACLLALVFGRKFTVTLRGNETMHAARRWRRIVMSWSLRRAAAVIAVSESLRQFAISLGVDPARTATIANGLDASMFYPLPRAQCRERLGMPGGVRIVLSVGYLIERKGHHRVIEALAPMLQDGATALWIIGGKGREGDMEQELRRLAARLGMGDRVRFIGPVRPAELAQYMSGADLLCLASSREGHPNAVQEALGCGLPVVATAVGGLAGMLPDASYGFVVEPENPAALAMALGKALHTEWDREKIARHGQSRSWESVAAETADCLKRAAGLR
jgi:glycosyltransferase involved in cell wall biosynthesis